MLYLTGDTHGENLGRFSYRAHPGLRELTEDDAVVVLGDTALMWPGREKETLYTLRQLARKPFTIVFLLGNHDNYDWAETLPRVSVFGGRMRQAAIDGEVFENRYVVDSWTTADLSGYHCMLIAHADSHDIERVYEPWDKKGIKRAKRNKEWFRVAHRTWWPQEALDIGALDLYLQEKKEERLDLVLTHDCPSAFLRESRLGLRPTAQERYFEHMRETLPHRLWAHGHMHWDWPCYGDRGGKRCCCLYRGIAPAKALLGDGEETPLL